MPVHSAWFGAVGAFILALPCLWNTAAYAAVTSIAVIGLYVAYLIPVFLRRINPQGVRARPVEARQDGVRSSAGSPSCGCVFICVLFCCPATRRSTSIDFNYTPVAVLVVIGFAGIWYAVSARKWFKGPKIQGTSEELAAIERELKQFD